MNTHCTGSRLQISSKLKVEESVIRNSTETGTIRHNDYPKKATDTQFCKLMKRIGILKFMNSIYLPNYVVYTENSPFPVGTLTAAKRN